MPNIDFENSQGKKYEQFAKKLLWDVMRWTVTFFETEEEQRHGESHEGIEIKFDGRSKDTERLSIETHENHEAGRRFVLSGIFKRDNTTLYVQGNYDYLWIFSKKRLIQIYREQRKNKTLQLNDFTPTLRAFFLDIEMADFECLAKIDCKNRKVIYGDDRDETAAPNGT